MKKPTEPRGKRQKSQLQMKDAGSAAGTEKADKPAPGPRRRKIESVIKRLDVSTLHEDQLSEVLLHVASSLNLRKALENATRSFPQATSNLCYTKSGSSPIVSLYSGPYKVGETTEANALARGIRPCG